MARVIRRARHGPFRADELSVTSVSLPVDLFFVYPVPLSEIEKRDEERRGSAVFRLDESSLVSRLMIAWLSAGKLDSNLTNVSCFSEFQARKV